MYIISTVEFKSRIGLFSLKILSIYEIQYLEQSVKRSLEIIAASCIFLRVRLAVWHGIWQELPVPWDQAVRAAL
jgi:hypothetical protein